MAETGSFRGLFSSLLTRALEYVGPRPLSTGSSFQDGYSRQVEPPPLSWTRWFLADLEAAIHQADQGNLLLAGRLCNALRRDGVISGVLSTRTEGLVQLPLRFAGDDAEVVAALASDFREVFPTSELALLAGDGRLLGIGVAEFVQIPGCLPTLKRLSPEYLKYIWSEDRWYYQSLHGIEPINPGDGRWVLHVPGGAVRPWTHGLWPALGRAYVAKDHSFVLRSAWEERFASPARVAVNPAGANDAMIGAFFAKVASWASSQVFSLPPGWDVKLLQASGEGYQVYQETIETCNQEMTICLAGQTVTTDGGAGFQNSDIHKSIRADLIQSDADSLSHTLETQGIPVWANERFGAGAASLSLTARWDVTPPADLTKSATAAMQAANAAKAMNELLASDGKEVDLDELARRYDVPLREKPEPVVDPALPEEPDAPDAPEPPITNSIHLHSWRADGSRAQGLLLHQAVAGDAVKRATEPRTTKLRTRAHAFQLSAESLVERAAPGQAPTAFRIWAAGENVADDGPIYFTAESAQALIDEQTARGRLYSIDFDHLSVVSDRPAEAGRAAGWMSLAVRPDASGAPELWAVNVEWTQDVRAGLEQEPPLWRYFSPAFSTDQDGVVTSFINLALCINPMTHGLPALASTKTQPVSNTKGLAMDPKKCAAVLKAMLDAEQDEEKKAALAKALADLPAEDDKAKEKAEAEGDDKPEEKTEAEGDDAPPSSKEPPAPPAKDDEEKKESKHSVKAASALARENVELRARLDKLEVSQALAARPDLSESVRAWCLTQSPDIVKSFLTVAPKTHAQRNEKATQGAPSVPQLEGKEREEMDRLMGIGAHTAKPPHRDPESGKFYLHTMGATQVRSMKKGAA